MITASRTSYPPLAKLKVKIMIFSCIYATGAKDS